MSKPPAFLPFAGEPAADRLLAEDPLAMLIGFALDQQVPLQKAFSGPAVLRDRIGHLDAARIAGTDPDELAAVFSQRPAIHRFPASMAGKVQALCANLASTYGGDAARIWTDASDGPDLRARLMALPGFGEMKVRTVLAVLAKQYHVDLPGLAELLPDHPTLGDADTYEKVAAYQAAKRAYKATLRAEANKP
jgi:uncharacterized HhH-GPD family protein